MKELNNLIFARPHQRINAPLNPDIFHDTYGEIFIRRRRNGQMSIWKKDTTQVSMATREKQRNAFLIFAWNEVENWEETRLKAFVLTIKPKKGKYI